MPGPLVPPTSIIEHVSLTLIPLLLGLLIGGSLAVATGFVLRFLYSSAPSLRLWFILLPWRTALALCLTVSSSLIIVLYIGMNPTTAMIGVALTVTLLVWTLATSVFVEHWSPTRLAARLVSFTRTLAVLTVVIAFVIGGQVGNLGLGAVLYRSAMMASTEAFVPILTILLIFALIIDLVLGVAQLIASLVNRNPEPRAEAATAE